MAIVKKIMGPPGTGKTYRLVNHYLKKELEEYKTNPEKIAYITFSRAAAEEAGERIEVLFPDVKLKYISTMHAMGMRQSNIDANTQLLTGKKWNRFKQEYLEWQNVSFETTVDAAGNPRYQNTHLQIIQYSRSKLTVGIFNSLTVFVFIFLDVSSTASNNDSKNLIVFCLG